ncbi:MAG: ATP-grasp domain-containing protein [Bacteroidales bacterium]|jgi:predicted ATP-grasp superfamily ATP-dependent carboligase|nr:ATP-grasp domain-containing protein [Bacteroidales bacterium]MCI2136049.1 ATP-grasp domain-containing protein [Bacteroidales bacterium]
MEYEKKVIILGNDHTNSLGLVQCLGQSGYTMIAVVWGAKTGFVKASRYASQVYSANNPSACIHIILQNCVDKSSKTPIIACSDDAALALEQNKDLLKENFLFEYAVNYSLEQLFVKELQVDLASRAGFNVPKSQLINDLSDFRNEIGYPCIIKPLVSCQGAKSDIRVCRTEEDLEKNIKSLQHTKRVLLQQYIERDYEISILGCGLKNGNCLIPCVENKLTLYPKNVGLECLANMQPLQDESIIRPIQSMIQKTGYVGPFSVEMMHCKTDGKFYFTEINLRNDGANSFVYKYGVNLPLNHIEDLMGLPITQFDNFKPGYYIWEMHHTLSLVHRELGLLQWYKELKKSRGFLTYFKSDKKPFYRQYSNWILTTLRIRKNETYE